MADDLKLLKSRREYPVYFVSDDDLVEVDGVNVYKKGFDVKESDFDFDSYDMFFVKNGYAPSLDKVARVRPDRKRRVPGIEIFVSGKFFENARDFYYLMLDSFGIDSDNFSQYSSVVRNRFRVRSKIDTFLEGRLYSALKQSRRAYERKIIELIEENIEHPERLFDLRVLGKREARRLPFNRINLNKALEKNVLVDIDWLMANKLLALYCQTGELRGNFK